MELLAFLHFYVDDFSFYDMQGYTRIVTETVVTRAPLWVLLLRTEGGHRRTPKAFGEPGFLHGTCGWTRR